MLLISNCTKLFVQRILSPSTTNYCIFCSRNFALLTTINRNEDINKKHFKKIDKTLLINNNRYLSYNESVVGFWKTISDSSPVAYIQDSLIKIHDITGLPWWASIVISTIIFRSIITLPLTIYQNKITARIENITLEMPGIVAELKKETALAIKQYKWTEKQARLIYNRSLKKQWNKLVVRDNCHPLKTLIVLWGQIPLWICQSAAIRNLIYMLPNPTLIEAQIIYAQMTVGGFGWIPNLTDIDHSLILPITLGILNLSIIEIQSMLRTRPTTRLQKFVTNAFRVFSVIMIPIAANVPSALCVYWVTSSAYGFFQNLLMLSPKLRRKMGIPKVQSEHEHPYQHLLIAVKQRSDKISSKFQSL